MKKLGTTDAGFLYTETERVMNHIASVQKFVLPEDVAAGEWVESLREYVAERCDRVDYMHRRLQLVPGNFDHPVWVEAADLDFTRHIVEVPLEAPGTMAQLERKIAELHGQKMDRSRPLWDMHVITGLEDGTIAIYNRIHHAAIDGISGQIATMLIMDTKPDHDPEEKCTFEPEETGVAEQLHFAFENIAKYQFGAGNRMLGQMDAMRRAMQRAIDPSRSFGAMLQQAPQTRFNQPVSAARSYAVAECDFLDVRSMAKQLHCSVNDVFMAICSGALRRYLGRCGELPETNLIAGCPVSLRQPGDSSFGNRVTMMSVDLATNEEDPKLRLLAIHESARIAKEVTADLAAAYDDQAAWFGLPATAAAASTLFERLNGSRLVRMPINVVLSNVPGPREPLYFNGARMETHYPVSIPAHGVGLNITVQSYGTRLYFGITACEEALPDAELLRDDLLAAFMELRQVLLPGSNVSELASARSARAPETTVNEAKEEETQVA